MLSMTISGLKQSGSDINIYLNPLIGDLRLLWEEGVDVDDAYTGDNFKLRVMLFCTINDFSTYDNLSMYNVKRHKACHIYEFDTSHHQLQHGKNNVYLWHRKFSRPNHSYRRLWKTFNGEQEFDFAPKPLTKKKVFKDNNILRLCLEGN